MTKLQYKELRRQYRIALRMSEELIRDQLIYGTSFQLKDDCGIFNIPPDEMILKDGKLTWTP